MLRQVLLVGAGGYIGTHTCASLSAGGHLYTAAVRGALGDVKTDLFPGGTVLAGIDLADLGQHPILPMFDDIVLLASGSVPATFPNSLSDEVACNLIPYANLLAKVASYQRVIFVSSGGTIYGEAPSKGGSREDDELRPRSMYGLVKLMIEQTIAYFARHNSFRYVILRPSNPVGPPVWRRSEKGIKPQQGALSNILNTIVTGGTVTQIGDETVLRDYFDVRDLAGCIRLLIDRPELTHITLNAGSGVGISIPHLLGIIKAVTGADFEVEHQPARPFDVKRSILDVSAAKEQLGWSPCTPIERSVMDTWTWFKQER